ncbi:MAG: response regulator transcription factor [Acidobacteriales bacterium]|nr:response regulator transcription factor [Terriglobales bacterium]
MLGTPRILLVDDHSAVRHALALVLAEEGIVDCRESEGRQEALDIAERELPDLALVDLSIDGALELVEDLTGRKIPVLVCSMREDPECVRRAMAAGARGYITKSEAPQELAHAVRDVLVGWMLISPRAAKGFR